MIPRRPLTESSMPKTGSNDFFLTWYLAQFSSLNLYYYIGKVSRWEIDELFFLFFQKIKKKTDISCKLSPWETICTKCQNHYSRKNKKHFKMSSAHILPSIFYPQAQDVLRLPTLYKRRVPTGYFMKSKTRDKVRTRFCDRPALFVHQSNMFAPGLNLLRCTCI